MKTVKTLERVDYLLREEKRLKGRERGEGLPVGKWKRTLGMFLQGGLNFSL